MRWGEPRWEGAGAGGGWGEGCMHICGEVYSHAGTTSTYPYDTVIAHTSMLAGANSVPSAVKRHLFLAGPT